MKRTRLTYLIFFFAVLNLTVRGQDGKLKASWIGLNIAKGSNVSKDSIINYTRFDHGKDDAVDILRFDNVGIGGGSDVVFIISSKEPIQVDEFGLTPLRLDVDSLKALMNLIQALDTKQYERPSGYFAFRMTYRLGGNVYQYFVGGPKESTEYFKKIEERILRMKNDEAQRKYYHFLWTTPLLRKRADGIQTYSPRGPIEWVY